MHLRTFAESLVDYWFAVWLKGKNGSIKKMGTYAEGLRGYVSL